MSASTWRVSAMKDAKVKVAVICQPLNYVIFDNGLQLPIQRWLNADRQECHPGEEPRFYEFGNDENGYGVGNYDAYDMQSWSDH
jgi:hypothetical protein